MTAPLTETQPLTRRQAEVLEYMLSTVETEGRQPTVREIAGHFGCTGANAAYCHLRALEKKGLVEFRGKKGVKFVGVTFRRVVSECIVKGESPVVA